MRSRVCSIDIEALRGLRCLYANAHSDSTSTCKFCRSTALIGSYMDVSFSNRNFRIEALWPMKTLNGRLPRNERAMCFASRAARRQSTHLHRRCTLRSLDDCATIT